MVTKFVLNAPALFCNILFIYHTEYYNVYTATCLLILKCDRLSHIWRFIKKNYHCLVFRFFAVHSFVLNFMHILNCIVLLQKFTIVTFYFWYIFYFLCKKVRVDWLLVYLVYKWCIDCHVQHIIGSVGNRKSNGVTSSLCITTLQVFIVHQCDFL